jgi:hypothetical protein
MPLAESLAVGEKKTHPELADVFRQYGESFEKNHRLSVAEHKVIRAVKVCRPKSWADTCIAVMRAILSARFTTPTATATAPSASRWLKPGG